MEKWKVESQFELVFYSDKTGPHLSLKPLLNYSFDSLQLSLLSVKKKKKKGI